MVYLQVFIRNKPINSSTLYILSSVLMFLEFGGLQRSVRIQEQDHLQIKLAKLSFKCSNFQIKLQPSLYDYIHLKFPNIFSLSLFLLLHFLPPTININYFILHQGFRLLFTVTLRLSIFVHQIPSG